MDYFELGLCLILCMHPSYKQEHMNYVFILLEQVVSVKQRIRIAEFPLIRFIFTGVSILLIYVFGFS